MKVVLLLLCFLALIITGCAQTPDSYDVLYGISSSKQHFLKRLLILPVDITIKERFPGDLYENVPLWSNQANHAIENELVKTLNLKVGLQTIKYRETENSTAVEQHIPLIESVARAIRVHSRGFDLWTHKMQRFDYTIGSGLNVLKAKNIDAALFIKGYQSIEVFRYEDTKESIYTYRKQDLSWGDLYLTLILIDVNTGELLWVYFPTFSNVDLRNSAEVRTIVSNILEMFPIKTLDI